MKLILFINVKLFKINFEQFKGRFKLIFSMIFIIFFFCNLIIISFAQEIDEANQILVPENLIEELTIGEYNYQHYQGPPYDFDIFQIYKGGELVYLSEIGFEYWLYKEDELYHHGDDITGNGIPNLLIMESSGGNFFPISCYVFSIGEQFELIKILPHGHFKDVNQDGRLEYITYEMHFSFWHACHADSPAPEIVYKYCDKDYLLAPDLMYKPLPSREEMCQVITQTKKDIIVCEKEGYRTNCWYYQGTYIPPSVWDFMLGLIFTGHPDEAYDFLDEVWPEDKTGKSNFIDDFNTQLNEKTIWPLLVAK